MYFPASSVSEGTATAVSMQPAADHTFTQTAGTDTLRSAVTLTYRITCNTLQWIEQLIATVISLQLEEVFKTTESGVMVLTINYLNEQVMLH